MKTIRTITIAAVTLRLVAATCGAADEVSGKWKADFQSPIGQLKYIYELKSDSGKLTGKAIRTLEGAKTETEIKEGKLSGADVSFVEVLQIQDQDIRIEYKGKLAGDEIKFTRKVGEFATMEIVAKREAATASVAGVWQAEFDTQIGKQQYTFTLKIDGDKVTGKANATIGGEKYETPLTEGKLKTDELAFVEMLKFGGNDLRIEYKGKIAGDQIKFTRNVGEVAKEEFVAKRAKKAD